MSFVSYAQNFEDVILWRALHQVDHGRYVDIGAQDPVHDSVSLAFYEAGWRGIHVEPTPYYASKLRAARPDETVIEAAITSEPGPLHFHEILDTGLSTGRADIARRHLKRGYHSRTIMVATIRLDKLLDGLGECHWMKIDVEGMEVDVIRSWGDSEARPWIVVVEATVPMEQVLTDHHWRDELIARGYQDVHFDGLSRYFVHNHHAELATCFGSPPNLFDGFQITSRHFSSAMLSQQSAEREAQLEGRIAGMQERLESAEAGRAAADQAAHQLKMRAEQLDRDLASIVRERDAVGEMLACAAQEHQATLEQILSDRLANEQLWRKALSTLENQLNANLAELASLRQRESKLVQQAETLVRDRERTRQQLQHELDSTLDRLDQQSAHADQERAEYEQQISKLMERSRSTDDQVRKALAEPVGGWQRLGRALGIAHEDRARRALQSWLAENQESTATSAEMIMNTPVRPEIQDYHRAASLAELLTYDSSDFIQVAYATVLGREPDESGEEFYRRRLDQGVSKIQLIDDLARSREARLFPYPPPDLKSELRRFRLLSLIRGKPAAGRAIETRVLARSPKAHVSQFMRYHDEEFVRVAFQYYLEREPEPAGLAHYISELRSGASRQRVLIDIARSRESRRLSNWAAGERVLALALAVDRVPLVGTIVAAVRFNLMVRQHLRDVRALQNHLYRISQK